MDHGHLGVLQATEGCCVGHVSVQHGQGGGWGLAVEVQPAVDEEGGGLWVALAADNVALLQSKKCYMVIKAPIFESRLWNKDPFLVCQQWSSAQS